MAAINMSGDGGAAAAAISSPRSKNRSRGVPSQPWTQIVRGSSGESEVVIQHTPLVPVQTSPSSSPSSLGQEQMVNPDWLPSKPPEVAATTSTANSDESVVNEVQVEGADNGGGSNASKKPVWNRPSNGVVEVVSPVMGAVSWPALGESTKASPKSTSSESLKALSDASLPVLQVAGNSSPSTHKQASANNANPTSTTNHGPPARQRSMKRGGGSSGGNVTANGGISQPPLVSQESAVETPHNTSGKPSSAIAESSLRDLTHKESQRGGFGSQSHSGNDHHHQRNSYRRGNGGNHPRGDGSYHHSYGSNKRDQDRGNQEWNQHSRSFNNRDNHLQPQRSFSRGYMRPAVSTPFIPPMTVPVRPFGNNMMYPDVAPPVIYVQAPPPPPPESLRAMSIVSPIPAPMYFPPVPDPQLHANDPQLHAKIVSQIDYYFSNENLIKDTYLRQNMDEQGWVPVSLIAGFKKVLHLTDNVQLILDAMRTSTVVEVQGDKLRRRNDWMRWIMPLPAQYSYVSSPQAVGRSPNYDGLASQLQGVSLDETTSKNQAPVDTFFVRSSSGEFFRHSQQAGGEGTD